jgi:predicted transport protein
METGFGQAAYTAHFDGFMRHYLTVRTGDIPRLADVYDAYKEYARTTLAAGGSIEDLVREVRDYAKHFCAMALGQEADLPLKRAFEDLRELKVDVAYPLLLELYVDYGQGLLSRDDFHELVRLIESYVFRRAICAIPTNSLNKTFATFGRALKKDRYLESAKAHFLRMKSYQRFPRDDEFAKDIQTRDLYNFRSRSYWLRRFENHERKELVPVEAYTIEHILPQNENLSPEWRANLGAEWKAVQERWLHTLGNLTLTGYNSEYSDRSFSDKRDMENGFRHSPLRVNDGLGAVEVWNEDAIKARAHRLATRATKVWRCVDLPAETLSAYADEKRGPSQYSISDHSNLSGGAVRDLFDSFRREVLALDPCVYEEFLKLYVAFKAETNFVDVVPLSKGLRLSLNIDPVDLVDARGVAVDVTGVGRWGNGNTKIQLTAFEDIPYVIGLVRQALERQFGGSEEP